MRPAIRILLAVVMVGAIAHPAAADLTAFLGVAPNPEARLAKGLAVGAGGLIFGFEFEWASISDDEAAALPGLTTWTGSALVQTPSVGLKVQLYAIGGFGVYRERLLDREETNVDVALGGGAKIKLAGPLKLRVDYRVFKLQGAALTDNPHRLYAGLALGF